MSTLALMNLLFVFVLAASVEADEASCKKAGTCKNDEIVPVSPNTYDRRKLDPISTIRPEHKEDGQNPLGVEAVEWKARTEAAALYRMAFIHGMGSDLAAQCVMHRIPGRDEFLMGEWGYFFEEQTASRMLRYDFDGNRILLNGTKVPAEPGRDNMGCVPIPPAIIKSRPEVQTVLHFHPISVMAVGGTKHGFLPLSQAAFFLHGQISRESYDFTYETSFEDSLQKGFSGGKRAMLLNHHGMYAIGRDAAEAFFVAKHLTQACDVQVKTMAMAGGNLDNVILPDEAMLKAQYKDMMLSPDYAYDGSREWPGLVRQLAREAPDYNL
eukprot:TRINITY_DN64881_c0_g1_i1.p1 TRINITY_DN64881_c0_g1~~TRINITY_DN64881_c0_g1_i1.p1  ORF type:complete len:325 (+),score=67.61 TRINITY_DN64881_c0_g1_i1:27-1001(+)